MKERESKAENGAPTGHPISVVAMRTGLSRDVLRVWERRYAAVEPMRTPGGQRLYSDAHVHRFRMLASATRHGRTISQVAHLDTDALARLVAEDDDALPRVVPSPTVVTTRGIDAALAAIVALDAPALDAHLRRAIARDGVLPFIEELVPSLMHAVGDGWVAGRLSIAHEHLASATVLAVILETVRAVPASPSAPRVLVASPSGERHAVGAALAAAAAALEGWAVVYLGADVPAADLATAAAATGAQAVALSIVHVEDWPHLLAELRELREKLAASVPLLIGGAGTAKVASELHARGIHRCASMAELRAALVHTATSGHESDGNSASSNRW